MADQRQVWGMPVFNGDRYIEIALDSLLAETFSDFEIVISDNASTDNTEAICPSYMPRDSRIRYSRNEENLGPPENFTKVFRLSRGEYFKWAAADDVCEPEFLHRTVDALDSHKSIVLAWVRTLGLNEVGVVRPHYPSNQLSDLNSETSTYSPDPMVRFRRVVRNIWWVDPPFFGPIRASTLSSTRLLRNHPSSDQLLLCDMVLQGRFFEVDEALFLNRIHPGQASIAHSRRELAVLLERDPVKKRRFILPKLAWFYLYRVISYMQPIQDAPLTSKQRRACYLDVVYAVGRWLRRPGKGGY
jgi:glycosyltransferase involved in cell wall biosynthesis